MKYTHLKVDEEHKTKFKKLAESHNLTMLRLFGLWVDTEYKKQFKAVDRSTNEDIDV